MYYLLEDNRIIDSKKTKYFDLYTRLDFLLEIDGETIIKNLGKIKKQSENVLDLIEVGDLVKIKQPTKGYDFGEYKEPEITNYASYIKDAFPNKILAIYKSDANGNYIKVWERQDE